MKKFYMALAAVCLLASCSKENVEPQPKQPQEAQESIDAVDPNTPGAIRLSLNAEVAPIELAQDNIFGEDGQEARGTELTVSGPNLKQAITYKITPGAGGKVPALLYLYDNVGGGLCQRFSGCNQRW
jgi:lipoprotein